MRASTAACPAGGAFRRFVEAIVAEEQRFYWQKRGDRSGNGAPSSRVPSLPSTAGRGEAAAADAARVRDRPWDR